MIDLILAITVALLSAFLFGLFRGSSVCLTVCAPGILPLILSKKSDLKESLKIALLLMMPRTFILAIVGGFVGLIFYVILDSGLDRLIYSFTAVHVVAYMFLGFILVFLGGIFFSRSQDDRKRIYDPMAKDCGDGCKPSSAACKTCPTAPKRQDKILLFTKKKGLTPTDQIFLGGWGILLSFGCMIEVIILEGPVIAAASAFAAPNHLTAFVFSAIALFLFGIGSSLPLIIVALLASVLHKKVKNEKLLYNIKVVTAIMIIIMGAVLLIRSCVELAVILQIGM